MSLTAGKGSDGWQTATTDAESILTAATASGGVTTLYAMAKSDNLDIALVNIPILHGEEYVPIPPGAVIPFTSKVGAILEGTMKMASGTGSVGWGVGARG